MLSSLAVGCIIIVIWWVPYNSSVAYNARQQQEESSCTQQTATKEREVSYRIQVVLRLWSKDTTDSSTCSTLLLCLVKLRAIIFAQDRDSYYYCSTMPWTIHHTHTGTCLLAPFGRARGCTLPLKSSSDDRMLAHDIERLRKIIMWLETREEYETQHVRVHYLVGWTRVQKKMKIRRVFAQTRLGSWAIIRTPVTQSPQPDSGKKLLAQTRIPNKSWVHTCGPSKVFLQIEKCISLRSIQIEKCNLLQRDNVTTHNGRLWTTGMTRAHMH